MSAVQLGRDPATPAMPTKAHDDQGHLFGPQASGIEPCEPPPELGALASRLSPNVRLGTMSWSFPGWEGRVYRRAFSAKQLAMRGLTAYAQHPLLGSVEIDRSYYEPLPAGVFRAFAEQVPVGFRFVAKAHEGCTAIRFPTHPRYGSRRGQDNPRFLDATHAADLVVAPFCEGLGDKAAALVFQFPPQDAGQPEAFAERLHGFLRQLPKGPTYAVELRNAELLTPAYAAALADTGAIHCHNIWGAMPSLRQQALGTPPSARHPLLIRWLLRPGDRYEDALNRYAPFHRLVDEDLESRSAIAGLVAQADRRGVAALVLINNKAEGCAPESIVRLARALVDLHPAGP
jgi:uncharacterized protein YecE (DUF72 family)